MGLAYGTCNGNGNGKWKTIKEKKHLSTDYCKSLWKVGGVAESRSICFVLRTASFFERDPRAQRRAAESDLRSGGWRLASERDRARGCIEISYLGGLKSTIASVSATSSRDKDVHVAMVRSVLVPPQNEILLAAATIKKADGEGTVRGTLQEREEKSSELNVSFGM